MQTEPVQAHAAVELLRRAIQADRKGDRLSAYTLYNVGITAISTLLKQKAAVRLPLARNLAELITRAKQLRAIIDAESQQQHQHKVLEQAWLIVREAEAKALQGRNSDAALLYRQACGLVLSVKERCGDDALMVPDTIISSWLERGRALSETVQQPTCRPCTDERVGDDDTDTLLAKAAEDIEENATTTTQDEQFTQTSNRLWHETLAELEALPSLAIDSPIECDQCGASADIAMDCGHILCEHCQQDKCPLCAES